MTLKIKRESRREVQEPQMSSVVFYGSKLLKAAVRYGNMKLVTIRAVHVRGSRDTLQLKAKRDCFFVTTNHVNQCHLFLFSAF